MKLNNDFDEWIDRSISHFMKLTDPDDQATSKSLSGLEEEGKIKTKDNFSMLIDEQTYLTEYFKRLRSAVNNYEEHVLFGSADLKNELLTLIKHDYHIVKIRIEVKPSAKIKDIRQHVFEKEIYYKFG